MSKSLDIVDILIADLELNREALVKRSGTANDTLLRSYHEAVAMVARLREAVLESQDRSSTTGTLREDSELIAVGDVSFDEDTGMIRTDLQFKSEEICPDCGSIMERESLPYLEKLDERVLVRPYLYCSNCPYDEVGELLCLKIEARLEVWDGNSKG